MNFKPTVSVIIIFFNAERFLEEAIQSVIAQTYDDWELLLVNDGSTDRSVMIAQHYINKSPQQIRILEHPDNKNRGKSPSRNLGIRHAKGKYVAFLDADDVWLPEKLKEQVFLLEDHPETGMVYGNTLYWYSWMKPSKDNDYLPDLGLPSNSIWRPPQLLTYFIQGKAAVPCICSLLVDRELVLKVNGFDESWHGISNIYEDQAFYAKIFLNTPVLVSNECWDKYRQHSGSSMSTALKTGEEKEARQSFLEWLGEYLSEENVTNQELKQALRKAVWLGHKPRWFPGSAKANALLRWFKKWVLRLEEWIVPSTISQWYWMQRS